MGKEFDKVGRKGVAWIQLSHKNVQTRLFLNSIELNKENISESSATISLSNRVFFGDWVSSHFLEDLGAVLDLGKDVWPWITLRIEAGQLHHSLKTGSSDVMNSLLRALFHQLFCCYFSSLPTKMVYERSPHPVSVIRQDQNRLSVTCRLALHTMHRTTRMWEMGMNAFM